MAARWTVLSTNRRSVVQRHQGGVQVFLDGHVQPTQRGTFMANQDRVTEMDARVKSPQHVGGTANQLFKVVTVAWKQSTTLLLAPANYRMLQVHPCQ